MARGTRSGARCTQVIAVLAGALLAACAVQALHPSLIVAMPAPPWGAGMVFVPLFLLALGRWWWPWPWLAALGQVPVALLALVAVAVTAAPAAIWPTGTNAPTWLIRWGFADSTTSLPFAAALSLFLVNLSISGAALVRSRHPAWLVIALVHGGLVLAIGSAVTGAGNTVRARVWLTEGAPAVHTATNIVDDQPVSLPLAIQLDDFFMDRWEPTLLVGHLHDGRWQYAPGTVPVSPGTLQQLGPYSVTIDEVMDRVAVDADGPRLFNQPGAGPAAHLTVRDHTGTIVGTGWAHAPTPFGPALLTELGGGAAVLMQPHRAKSYRSQVRLDGVPALIEVNLPLRHGGWWMYQTGFDDSAGPGSIRSQLELVHDPGLFGVYAGCALLIAGIALWLWSLGTLVRTTGKTT